MKATITSGKTGHDLWVALFVVLVTVGIFLGHGLIIAFGVMGLVAGAVSWVWNRWSLNYVTYRRYLSEYRVFRGEEVPMTVALINKKPVPLAWIHVEDEIPEALEVVRGDVPKNVKPKLQTLHHSTSMAWYERIRWNYLLRCNERGLYQIGPATIESGDPFGFLRSRKGEPLTHSIIVYPRVYPLDEIGIPGARPLGEVRGGMRIYQDPTRPAGIREYEAGDPLKTVDWKSTAKAQALRVRTYEPSSSFTVILVVAVDTAIPYWGPYSPEDLELVITAAASVGSYAADREYTLGLFSNDMPVLDHKLMSVAPSRGRDLQALILNALAAIRPYAVGPMSTMLAQHSKRFPFGSTLVVATTLMHREFVSTLVELKRSGFKIVVLYVGEEPRPELPEGILVYDVRERLLDLERASDGGGE